MEPEPPYVAVLFSSVRTGDDEGYAETADRMEALAAASPGYLGIDSVAGDGRSITLSYWAEEGAALAWKRHAEHLLAQQEGRNRWYSSYEVRVATVTRQYRFRSDPADGAGSSSTPAG
jgi:heme-degrading monooxygenase HmoA